MLRLILLMTILLVAWFGEGLATWSEPEKVNQYSLQLQAVGALGAFSIAADDSGTVHIVIETQDVSIDSQGTTAAIHYRDRHWNGTWGGEVSVTLDETVGDSSIHPLLFGHPAIIFNDDVEGVVSYVIDAAIVDSLIEMRTRRFEYVGGNPFLREFQYMSNQGPPYVHSREGDGKKTAVMAIDNEGVIYGFWPYRVEVNGDLYFQTYFNEYFQRVWHTEQSLLGLCITDPYYQSESVCALADPNGDIHLAIAMTRSPDDASVEVYHCWYDVSADTWYPIELVSEPSEPDGDDSMYPYLAFSGEPPDVKMHVIWEERLTAAPSEVHYRRYHMSQGTWDEPETLWTDGAGQPCIAGTPSGYVFAVWRAPLDSIPWIWSKIYNPSLDDWGWPPNLFPPTQTWRVTHGQLWQRINGTTCTLWVQLWIQPCRTRITTKCIIASMTSPLWAC